MKRATWVLSLVLVGGIGSLLIAEGIKNVRDTLTGYEEVPSISTTANGLFEARISNDGSSIEWRLSYSALEGAVTQAHIHFGQKGVNGGISVFFCSNLGNGPVGTPACPAGPATLTGTFTAANVVGPDAQGIEPGAFAELVAAIRAGKAYANVHSTKWPGGEIRAQIDPGHGH
jgi:hypothetical protein